MLISLKKVVENYDEHTVGITIYHFLLFYTSTYHIIYTKYYICIIYDIL